MIAAALVGVVLLQRSEGGALGIGGGGGGFMTGRGAANFLTRVTAGLAAAFFVTSLLLTLLANRSGQGAVSFGTEPGTSRRRPRRIVPSAGKEPAGKPPAAVRSCAAASSSKLETAACGVAAPQRAAIEVALAWVAGHGLTRIAADARRDDGSCNAISRRAAKGRGWTAKNPLRIAARSMYSAGPWRGTSSSPAAWSPRSAKGWLQRLLGHFFRHAATRFG